MLLHRALWCVGSDISEDIRQAHYTTWCKNPEDPHMNNILCENLKTYNYKVALWRVGGTTHTVSQYETG